MCPQHGQHYVDASDIQMAFHEIHHALQPTVAADGAHKTAVVVSVVAAVDVATLINPHKVEELQHALREKGKN